MRLRQLTIAAVLLGAASWPAVLGKPDLVQAQQPGAQSGRVDRFDDPLPPAALRRLGTVRFRHGDRILALASSPDGKLLAAGGGNAVTCLWDASTGKLIRQFRDDTRQLRDVWSLALAFSPDGRIVASANGFKTVRLWEAATGRELRVLKGHQGAVKAVAFSPDGTRIATGSQDRTVRLWDANTGNQLALYEGHQDEVNAVAFGPDGTTVASGSGDRTIRLWNGKLPRALNTGGAVYALAYAPGGDVLASAGDDNVIRLWAGRDAKPARQLKGHKDTVVSLAFADGKTLFSGSLDGTARRWDTESGTETLSIPRQRGDCEAMALLPGGAVLASGGTNHTVRRYDARTGKPLPTADGHVAGVSAVVCSPDGQLIASAGADGELRLWEAATGKDVRRWRGPHQGELKLAFSPDGKTLAAGGGADGVRLWTVASGKETGHLAAEGDLVLCLAYAPDGKRLAVGYRQGGVRVWDPAGGKVAQQLKYDGGVHALAYSTDGKLLAGAGSGKIALWDPADGQQLREVGKGGPVASLAFTPDGRRLAAGMFDSFIQLHDLKDLNEARLLEGHQSAVYALAFAPNGRTLTSASYDGTVRLWETVNGQQIFAWQGHAGPVAAVAVLPRGRAAVSGAADTTLLVWDMTGVLRDGQLPQVAGLQVLDLDNLWNDLASNDNPKGNRALWTLVGAAQQSAPYLTRKVFLTDPAKIARYITDLNDNKFAVREKASSALASYGRWIEGVLTEAVKNPPSDEVRRRLEKLLMKLRGKEAVTLEQERLRARRVLEVLEQANTPAARALLRQLASGAAEPDLRWTAADALARLKKMELAAGK